MGFIVALYLESKPYIQWPVGWVGWAGALVYAAGLALMTWQFRLYGKRWDVREWAIFAGLFIAELITTLFVGIRIPFGEALPAPNPLQTGVEPALMVFAALPWILASGLLGTWASTGLALLSGLLLALWDTHQVFTILEFGVMGLAMGVGVNQMYRTRFFRMLRHPIIAGMGILMIYPILYVIGVLLGLEGSLPVVLDFALAHLSPMILRVGIMLLLAIAFSEVIAFGLPGVWGKQGTKVPSPGETSLEIGAFYVLGPAVFVMVGVLGWVGWNVATRAARELLSERMIGAAEVSAENVPLAVEVGQDLILKFAADEQANQITDSELASWLQENVRVFPYFQNLIMVSSDDGESGYRVLGSATATERELMLKEQAGVALAFQGVPFQFYVVETTGEPHTASLTFIARVMGDEETSDRVRVLLGQTELTQNPFALNIVRSLDSVEMFDGEGFLADDQGLLIYHPEPDRVMTAYSGPLDTVGQIIDQTNSTGTRNMTYAVPIEGQPWTVVVTVPAQAAQRLALRIAAPLIGLLVLLALVLMVVTRLVMRLVTRSLKTLATEAGRIASNKDELATPLEVSGVDEVGQMRQAFEQMRVSLKAYLDEREETLLMTQIGEERLSAIIESTPDPVLVTDGQNRLLLANSVAKHLFGNGKVLEKGSPIEELIFQDEIIELMEAADDEILTREITLPDGRVYVAKAKSVVSEDKQRMGQVCVLRDVTRFKELDMLKSDFVASVSHDLRSPLTLVRGYATMVQVMGQLNDEQVKYIRRIEHGVDRMGHMVNNLLDLGRIESGLLKLEMVSILDIVKQVVASLQYQAEHKKIILEGHYPENKDPFLEVDPSLLGQAISNLVENAIKYTEAGGKIKVSLLIEPDDANVLIEVEDNGIGISSVDQLRLFEKFYRVPNKKAQVQRGSGLGLAIVKSIVDQHKGHIWVQSELDKGSIFYIRLPFKQKVAD